MKGGGHHIALADKHRESVPLRENLNAFAHPLDSRCADINLLERFGSELCGEREDGRVNLTPVRVPSNRDVDCA
jgi:hypothetical protein